MQSECSPLGYLYTRNFNAVAVGGFLSTSQAHFGSVGEGLGARLLK